MFADYNNCFDFDKEDVISHELYCLLDKAVSEILRRMPKEYVLFKKGGK